MRTGSFSKRIWEWGTSELTPQSEGVRMDKQIYLTSEVKNISMVSH